MVEFTLSLTCISGHLDDGKNRETPQLLLYLEYKSKIMKENMVAGKNPSSTGRTSGLCLAHLQSLRSILSIVEIKHRVNLRRSTDTTVAVANERVNEEKHSFRLA